MLAQNEVFVLPSYHEGLSLSLLEAAMMGKKIIATDIGGNREVVKDGVTGFLVPVKNTGKLAHAMLAMLEEHSAVVMAKNAREFYKRNFDFEKIFREKMAQIYKVNNK